MKYESSTSFKTYIYHTQSGQFASLKILIISYFSFSRFYPYLLLTSSFFLFLTLIVYTFWSKLLTHYTRIMRHYTLSLFLAFIILAINQFHTLKDFNLGLCIASGKHRELVLNTYWVFNTLKKYWYWFSIHFEKKYWKRY